MKGRINLSQAAGASYSYLRRYALAAAFGIVSDPDIDDATSAPAPADEQRILTEPAKRFFITIVELLPQYDHVLHAQAAAKKEGYSAVPGIAEDRVTLFRILRDRERTTAKPFEHKAKNGEVPA